MPTETTTAAIITGTLSTMPTAVMIESSENTMSMMMICRITAPNVARTALDDLALVAFEQLVDLVRALPQQEQPADDQDEVAARDALADAR